ncbi:MAG: GspH/FimT family protein [Gemmatimonadales bacterium]
MRESRGLTLIEILIVIVLIGLIALLAYPRIGSAVAKENLRSAKGLVGSMHAKAKATAVQRGQRTVLWFDGDKLVLRSRNPVSGAVDTVGSVEDLYERYGATLTPRPTRDSLVFDPRGLGTETSGTTIYIQKGSYSDSLVVTSIGRVIK